MTIDDLHVQGMLPALSRLWRSRAATDHAVADLPWRTASTVKILDRILFKSKPTTASKTRQQSEYRIGLFLACHLHLLDVQIDMKFETQLSSSWQSLLPQ